MEVNQCLSENCLSKLIGIRSTCPQENCATMYIEDLEGVDMTFLANTSTDKTVSGEAYAKQLINTAARIMLGDIELLMTSGYSLVQAFGETCSTCNYVNTFQAGGGVVVRNLTGSKVSMLNITKVEVNCDSVTEQVLVFDDGVSVKKFAFQGMGMNVIAPVLVDYKTQQPSVKISIENVNVKLASIVCGTKSGCGCSGGSGTPKDTVISYTGLLLGMLTPQQYGFRVCANVICSSDVLICGMVQQKPNLFGLTLLYKVGALLYGNAPLVTRNNRTTSMGEEIQITMADYYNKLYQERIRGTKTIRGLNVDIVAYLSRNQDKCVVCDHVNRVAYATG